MTNLGTEKIKKLFASGLIQNIKLACQLLLNIWEVVGDEEVIQATLLFFETVDWMDQKTMTRDPENFYHQQKTISCSPCDGRFFCVLVVSQNQVFAGKTTQNLRPQITWITSFFGDYNRSKDRVTKKILFFDTETNGKPKSYPDFRKRNAVRIWCRLVQIAWQLTDNLGNILSEQCHIIKPDGFAFSSDAMKVHLISEKRALVEGVDLGKCLEAFMEVVAQADIIIAHNIEFDVNVVGAELKRAKIDHSELTSTGQICTKLFGTDYCAIYHEYYHYKYPTLTELYETLFGEEYDNAHNALADTTAVRKCYFALLDNGVEMEASLPPPDESFKPKPARQLPPETKEDELPGMEWVCKNSAAKRRLQGVLNNLRSRKMTFQNLSKDAQKAFVTSCIKKGFDFLPTTHFTHDKAYFGKKVSECSSEELIEIWNTWGGNRRGWEEKLIHFKKWFRPKMRKYYEKVESNVQKRGSEIYMVLSEQGADLSGLNLPVGEA